MPLIIVFGHWLAVYFMDWCDNYWTNVWPLNYFLFLIFSCSLRERLLHALFTYLKYYLNRATL